MLVRGPNAGNPQDRIDERDVETGTERLLRNRQTNRAETDMPLLTHRATFRIYAYSSDSRSNGPGNTKTDESYLGEIVSPDGLEPLIIAVG